MAKFDIQELNYITAGKSQNTFNITYRYTDDGMIQITDQSKYPTTLSVSRTHTFFGDIGEYNDMSEKFNSNKSSLYDITNNIIIHNLYNINKTKIQTTAKKYNTANEHKDIYVPYISDDFIKICQFESNAYCLTKEYTTNPIILSVHYNNNTPFDISYYKTLGSNVFNTLLYPSPNEINSQCSTYTDAIISAGELSNECISSIFCPNKNLIGIKHNYIIELPENGKYIDYTTGHILGDTVITQNHLNDYYTMSVDNNYKVYGCREYCNIDCCGTAIYMTYRNNVNYNVYQQNINQYYHDETNILSITEYNLSSYKSNYNYQRVEVINSWNRFDGNINAGHKSNLFSIKLTDTGLNNSTISENAKHKLRQDVENNVRMIINNLIPAHTQLFNIYFDGK